MTSAMIYAFQNDSDDLIKMTLEEASWLRKREAILFDQQGRHHYFYTEKKIYNSLFKTDLT